MTLMTTLVVMLMRMPLRMPLAMLHNAGMMLTLMVLTMVVRRRTMVMMRKIAITTL